MTTADMGGGPPERLVYLEPPSVPPGMTIAEYRRSRPGPSHRWRRIRRLVAPAA